MCQATVYFEGEIIMRDVLMIEPTPEGIRLISLFEPVVVVPAAIRQIDLIKHRVILEPIKDEKVGIESRETSDCG